MRKVKVNVNTSSGGSKVPKRTTFDKLASKLGIVKQEDWYRVHPGIFKKVTNYNTSTICSVYPEFDWHIWLFRGKPVRYYWDSVYNQRTYFNWLRDELELDTVHKLYSLTPSLIASNYGTPLLEKYGNSIYKIVKTLYPNLELDPLRFKTHWEKKNHRIYFDLYAKESQIEQQEQWYDVTQEMIMNRHGKAVLDHYSGSLMMALESAYPEFDWLPWNSPEMELPYSFWNNMKNQKNYVEWLATQLNIKDQTDWANVSNEDLYKFPFSKKLLSKYKGSLSELLKTVYPQTSFNDAQTRGEAFALRKLKSHRDFFDRFAAKLGIKELDQWYSIPAERVSKSREGALVLEHYDSSLHRALCAVYPDHDWKEWQFISDRTRPGKESVYRTRFDLVASSLNITQQMDWYSVKCSDALAAGGRTLLENFDGSLCKALQRVYPEYDWHPWQFPQVSRHFWNHLDNQRRFLDWLGEQFEITEKHEWYKVTTKDAVQRGAAVLLNRYGGSLSNTLRQVYSEYPWQMWHFEKLPNNFWYSLENQRNYFDWVAKQLRIVKPHHWTRLSIYRLKDMNGSGILSRYGSMVKALQAVYPEIQWDNIFSNVSEGQKRVSEAISSLTRESVLINYRHPLMVSEYMQSMELDIYIPALKIAFEYQGAHHYQQYYNRGTGALSQQKGRDEAKRDACRQLGITLIEIPYWWNCSKATLASTLKSNRPDITIYDNDVLE